MKHFFVLISFIGLIAVLPQWAAAKRPPRLEEDRNQPGLARPMARPEAEFKIMGLGNLRTAISNYGSIGDPNFQTTGRPSVEWPAGSVNSYLYDSGFWCTTIVGGEKTVSAYFYSPDTEWNPTDGSEFFLGGGGKSILDSVVEYDDFDEFPASEHIPLGIKVRRRGLSWSMPEFDDFIIFEYEVINTGLVGDHSGFYCSFWYDIDVAGADNTAHHIDDLVDYDGFDYEETDSDKIDWVDPLDLDGDGQTGYDQYGLPYADPNNPLHDPNKADPDGYPDEYQIFINSADIYDRDTDEILSAKGDTILIPRGMSFIYDWDNATTSENDIGERGLTNPECTGYMGGRLLYTEHISAVDDDYELSPENLPIPYSHQWWNWESDPVNVGTDPQKYDYVIGRHEFSQGYRYLPNPLSLGAPSFDYRFLLSSGPFEFAAGDTIRLVWAVCMGQGLGGLRANSDKALEAYYQGSRYSNPAFPSGPTEDDHYVLPIPPEIPDLTYSPSAGGVKLAWSDAAEVALDQMLGRPDFEGYKIYRAQYAPDKWEMIAAFDNRPDDPVYVVDTDGDTLNPGNPVDLPAITHIYVDTGGTFLGRTIPQPVDGLPYYYAVVAFDPVKPEVPGIRPMLPPMESARTNYQQSFGVPLPIYPTSLYETGDAPKDLSEVMVAPNPYKGTSLFEARYEDKIRFLNLPPTCKISIYTMVGDLVDEIEHIDGSDSELWNLISRNNQSVVSGLYIYVVETEADKHIGKFVIMR